jgi:hypothetical protein
MPPVILRLLNRTGQVVSVSPPAALPTLPGKTVFFGGGRLQCNRRSGRTMLNSIAAMIGTVDLNPAHMAGRGTWFLA